jgi:hypothetical protein
MSSVLLPVPPPEVGVQAVEVQVHDLVAGNLVVAGDATRLVAASVAVGPLPHNSYLVVTLAVVGVVAVPLLVEVVALAVVVVALAVVEVAVAIPLPAGGGYNVAVAMRCCTNYLDIAVWLVPPFAVAPASASFPLPGTGLPMAVVVVAVVL